jgi:PAS domain S-box-containing protein
VPEVRLGRYGFQVRVVLVLLVLFFVVLNVMSLFLLARARSELERAEIERLRARAERVTSPLAESSRRGEEAWAPSPTALRRLAVASAFDRVALLDPGGTERAASGPVLGTPLRAFGRLDSASRATVFSGRAACGLEGGTWGGQPPRLWCLLPLLDPSGRPAAIVEVEQFAFALGQLDSRLRLTVAVEIAGVLAIVALAVLFESWVRRPYRKLAAAVGEAGWIAGGGSDPDELLEAFRQVALKLREQDEALHSIGREAGALGDVVRLATGPMRKMTTGLLVVDRRGAVAAMNPAAESLLGSKLDEARGRPVEEAVSGIEGLAAQIRASIREGRATSREVLPRSASGQPGGFLGVSVSPAVGPEGEIEGAVVLMTDLTEIRKLREEARLRERLAWVGQFAAGIAHEFRNGLGTILGYARMLEKREDPRVRGPAQEILKEIVAIESALEDFLLYARPPEPRMAPVDMGQLVRSCAAGAPDGVSVAIEGEFGTIQADEGLLRRAFGNLLRNAAEAGASVGRPVTVRIAGRRVGPSGRTLQIEVEDDGPGIPEEQRLQVFHPFFTTKAKGTGLGLAHVHRTILEHGGTIEAGRGGLGGALFRIRLPAGEAHPRHES